MTRKAGVGPWLLATALVFELTLAPRAADAAARDLGDSGPPQQDCLNNCKLVYDFCNLFSWGSEAIFLMCFNNYYACIRACGWVPPEAMAENRCTPPQDHLRHILEPDSAEAPWLLQG